MDKISFKEYFESKEKLKEAIKLNPLQESIYLVKKYCKLPVMGLNEEKEYIALKPKDRIIILWEYEDVNYPNPKNVTFENSTNFIPVWNKEKMLNWVTETLNLIQK